MNTTTVETRSGEKKVRLIGRKIHVLRCLKGRQVEVDGEVGYMRGNIFVPEPSAKQTPFFTILAIGPECKYFTATHIGKKVLLARDVRGWCEVLPDGERIFDERVYDKKGLPGCLPKGARIQKGSSEMPLCVFD